MDDITNSQEFIVADLVTGAIERHENSHAGNVFSQTPQRLALGLARGEILARGLALVGVLLFAISVCLPWVMVILTSGDPAHPIVSQVRNGSVQNFIDFPLEAFGPLFLLVIQHTPQRLLSHLGVDTIGIILHGVIPALGILLSMLIWRKLDNHRARLAVLIFGGWTVFCTLFTLFSIERLLTRYQLLVPPFFNGEFGLLAEQRAVPHIWTGFWLALVSLVVQWVALIFLVREMARTRVRATQPSTRQTPRSWPQIGGALALTVGVPLWGVSYFMLYWATTSGCSVFPFVQKFCIGRLDAVDGVSGLSALIDNHIDPNLYFNSASLLTILFMLVTFGGLSVIVSAWLRAQSSMRTVWLLLWEALSALLTGYAAYGMLRAVANQTDGNHYTLAPGIYLACLAVVANLLAVCLIWQSEHHATPLRVAPTAHEPVIWG